MSRIKNIVKRYGLLNGLTGYLKLKLGFNKINLKGMSCPIYLRKNTSDPVLFKQIFYSGEYDIPVLFEPKYIIDGGANIGLFSVLMANRFPAAKILSIEPDESNFKILQNNVAGYANIDGLKAAIWNKNTHINLSTEEFDKCAIKIDDINNKPGQTVEAKLLEDIIAAAGFPYVDILKLDVEGAEKEIFESSYEKWLPTCKMLIIELHDFIKPGSSAALLKAIGRYDFSFFWVGENFCLINNDLKKMNEL